MGQILSAYKKAILEDTLNSITTGLSNYYAFAAGPVPYANGIPALTNDDYTDKFTNDWQMMFGKLITSTNIAPMILNVPWTTNTVFTQYDNTNTALYNNPKFYVVSPPTVNGAAYAIYKCISNANGAPSTVQPTLVQSTTFTTSDGYAWRYITSITAQNYSSFATSTYVPAFPNTTIQAAATQNATVDNIVVANGGSGYSAYVNGAIQGGNTAVVQIDGYASSISGYYVNSGIYVIQNSTSQGQLRIISNYVSNTTGNWVYLNQPLSNVTIGATTLNYIISPQVVCTSDGIVNPSAYSVVNTSTNSISSIVILNGGSYISWCNVSIASNSSLVTSQANCYAIVPPPGGHGSDPQSELGMVGFGMSFQFANNEANTIPVNVSYNKVGIIKNPYILSNSGLQTSNLYTSNTFNAMLQGTVTTAFANGSQIIGTTSNAQGIVAFCNGSAIYVTGDKTFVNNETIQVIGNASVNSTLTISTLGNIYTKGLNPLYITNISNINRSNVATEAYQLVVLI